MQDPAATELRLPQASADALRAAGGGAQRDRAPLDRPANAGRGVVYRLDQGTLRVAEKGATGWAIHGWIQQAINLFFGLAQGQVYAAGDLRFFDKIPPKRPGGDFRVVPPGVVRYGAHVEKGAIVMPGYVNIGARVGAGSMVDTWATVGSCAQVGRGVRSEEHTSELQSRLHLVCRLLLEKKKKKKQTTNRSTRNQQKCTCQTAK